MTFALADKPSRIGLCHGCDAPCYERMDYFPSNHARAGEPMRVHGLKADARIAEFLLSDGSTMNSVLCAGCAAEVRPDDYPAIMRRFRVSCEEELDDLRRAKLNAKQLDLVVANDVSQEGSGFDSDYNTVLILGRNGLERRLPRLRKIEVAHEILDEVVSLRSHGRS